MTLMLLLYPRLRLPRLITLPLLALVTLLICLTIAPAHSTPAHSAPAPATLAPATPTSPCQEAVCPPMLVANAALMQQGKALYDAGQFGDAIAVLQQAAATYQQQGDSLRQAIALSNLALSYQHLGKWEDAHRSISDSVSLLRSQTDTASPRSMRELQPGRVLAQALDIQGDLQLEAGQAETALSTWQQAAQLYQQGNDQDGILLNQINQAQALRVLGYYRRALTMLTDLQTPLQSQPNSMTKVVALRSLGNALRLVGDLDQSRQVLQSALALVKQLPQTQESRLELSAILFGLGNTVRTQDPTAATQFYQQAADLAPTLLGKVQAQINQVSLLLESGQLESLETLLQLIQTQLNQLPVNQSSTYARIHLAQSLLQPLSTNSPPSTKTTQPPAFSIAKRVQTAAKLLAIATQQAQQLGDRRAESAALGTLGNAYEQTNQIQEAHRLTQQALQLAEILNARDMAYRWHWQQGRLFKQQTNLPAAIAAYDRAVEDLRSLRGDLVAVNRDVQFSFRESVEPVYRESVELLVQQQGQRASEANLDKARQRIETLQLAELDNFFREACLDSQTVLLDKVVDQDNPTTAIIYPIILPNQLAVIVKIPRQPLKHHAIAISKPEVETALKQFRQNLADLDSSKMRASSEQVYRWLIEPIQPDLQRQGVKTLVFVLDGALRNIPMASLYDGHQYLIEQYAVALSLGMQLLPPKPLANEPLNILAAGLIEPPPPFQQQFAALPEVKSEFELIAKTGVSMQKLLDEEFTSQALETYINSRGFNVVHLATHGQFSSQAKETFILAADGPINVTQLDALLQRRNQVRSEVIELLVLSACQTAMGDDRATLGLAGVAIKAGARSTLASLWAIDDRSTALLIGEFYQSLTQQKVTKAEALRQAQVALLKKYPNYTRPNYWAPYVLVGNWL